MGTLSGTRDKRSGGFFRKGLRESGKPSATSPTGPMASPIIARTNSRLVAPSPRGLVKSAALISACPVCASSTQRRLFFAEQRHQDGHRGDIGPMTRDADGRNRFSIRPSPSGNHPRIHLDLQSCLGPPIAGWRSLKEALSTETRGTSSAGGTSAPGGAPAVSGGRRITRHHDGGVDVGRGARPGPRRCRGKAGW